MTLASSRLFPETLKRIRNETQCPIIAYIWDDPFYSYAGLFADDFRKFNFEKGMHLYDYIFLYDTFYNLNHSLKGNILVRDQLKALHDHHE